MKEKSILEMVGGEKHINPHYNIKTEELKDEMKNRISIAEMQRAQEQQAAENRQVKTDAEIILRLAAGGEFIEGEK